MKYLIVGRTAAGKDTLARILGEEYGFRQVLSATTRPRRSPDEATHRFVTEAEAAAEADKVAQTRIGEHLYYATRADVEAADIYIIDPPGMMQLAKAMPEENFVLVVVVADRLLRAEAFAARARQGNPSLASNEALEMFNDRDMQESARFSALEKACAGPARPEGLPGNVSSPVVVFNDMEDLEALRGAARKIASGHFDNAATPE